MEQIIGLCVLAAIFILSIAVGRRDTDEW